jgi:hypothetical protein
MVSEGVSKGYPAAGLSAHSPHFGIRAVSEIPAAVIDSYRHDLIGGKRDLFISANFDEAAFAGSHLLEPAAIAEFHGDYLITDTGLTGTLQRFEKFNGNGNDGFQDAPPAPRTA